MFKRFFSWFYVGKSTNHLNVKSLSFELILVLTFIMKVLIIIVHKIPFMWL